MEIVDFCVILCFIQELNLYTENFSAMATQAAVLAGFTTTCLIEIHIPDNTSVYAKAILHFSAIISICANISCVSLSTITTIWGSGMALRGKDGSMDEAVEGKFFISLYIKITDVLCLNHRDQQRTKPNI